MTKRLHSDSRIQGIFNAISAQTGDTTPMTTADMAQAITEISGADLMDMLASASEIVSGTDGILLTDATVKTKATAIPSYMGQSKAILEVSFADVTEVRRYAFYHAIRLTNINLPKVETIAQYAFQSIPYQASTPVSLNVPKVKTIGEYAFEGSKVSGDLNLPECKSVGNSAFGSTKITSLSAPSLKTIGTYAFAGITTVPSSVDINLPSVITIGESAFSGFTSTNFTIGENCTSIGRNLFSYGGITNLFILASTPPTLQGQFKSGYTGVTHIYVPANSVAAYQAANVWSNYSSIIEAIPS